MLLLLLLVMSSSASLDSKDSPYDHPEITSYDAPLYGRPERRTLHEQSNTDKTPIFNEIPQLSTSLQLPKETGKDAAVNTYTDDDDQNTETQTPHVEVVKEAEVEFDPHMYDVPKVVLDLEPDKYTSTYESPANDQGYDYVKQLPNLFNFESKFGDQHSRHYSYHFKNSHSHSNSYNYKTTADVFKNSPFFANLDSFFNNNEQFPLLNHKIEPLVDFNNRNSNTDDDDIVTLILPKDAKKWRYDWLYKYHA